MHSDDIHNTDIDNDKVPPNILHRDLFGVEISHEKKPLAIYDNAEATYEAQGDASEPTEHVGYFSGLINKILVRPVVLPKSNRTMHMSFSLMPGFDFRSGDAVLVELRIGSTTRKSEVISKDGHEAKQLDSSEPKGKESIEQSGDSSNADKPTDPTRTDSPSEQVTPGTQDSNLVPSVEQPPASQEQAAGGTESGQEPSLPIRLRDEANFSQSEAASGSDGAEISTTSPATLIHSDNTPDRDSGAGGVPKGSVVGSTPALARNIDDVGTSTRKRGASEAFEIDREQDLLRLEVEVAMAKADFDVDDAKAQEITDRTSNEYFGLLLKRAKSHHAVVDAELGLKKAQLDGHKDSEYRELKTRKAEARLAVLKAEESAGVDKDALAFRLEEAQAEFRVAKAKVKQMAHGGRADDVEFLRAMLKMAQANSCVALAEFKIKAAECGDHKDAEYFQLQTRKAEAHREAVQAQRTILLRTGAL